MTNVSNKLNGSIENVEETKLDLPTHIGDIIDICEQYSMLGWSVRHQIKHLLEVGIDEAIQDGTVNVEALPHIRDFLESITEKMFGDVIDQCYTAMMMIDDYELKHPYLFRTQNKN